jgi:eukaryotic-like serine/threonine-protein kinase
MDAEHRRQLEQDAAIMDSIALEALSSIPASPANPGPELDAAFGRPGSPREARFCGLNEDPEGATDPAHTHGEPIDEYCDRRRLNVRSRIELFIQVCKAVHVAHQHAVIHRDLKPDNILVTSDGAPKLVGFGKANPACGRSANAIDVEAAASLARAEEQVLTPEYTSPEQVMGEMVTTASDIYALGVIFYGLMTGRRPYHFKTQNVFEVLQAICEQAPEKPSASVIRLPDLRTVPFSLLPLATVPLSESTTKSPPSPPATPPCSTAEELAGMRRSSPRQLKRVLRGDLDAIILTAMRKEPERRYASADQFALDLSYYLKRLPVSAQRDSAAYRTLKFMRRHIAAVSTGAVLVAMLVAGIMGSTLGFIMARRERDRAEEASYHALRTVNQFFAQVNEERLLNQPGLDPLRKALLQDTQRFYEDFLARHGGDRSLQAELAAAGTNLAQISGAIGSTTKAVAGFEQAVTFWGVLVAAEPANSAYREALARTLDKQGSLMMRLPGRRDEVYRIFRRTSELLEPLVAESRSARVAREFSSVLLHIAEIEHERGQAQEALKNTQRSLTIESKLAAKGPEVLDSLIAMAKGHALLGRIFATQPDGTEQAILEYRRAIERLEQVNHKRPEFSDQAYELGLCLGELSNLEQTAGRLDSALASARKAVEGLEQLERQHPRVLAYEHALASTYHLMSELHRYRREPADAIAFAQKAKTLLESLIPLQPDDATFRIDLAKSHTILGRLLQQTGEPVEALRSFQRAVDVYESLPKLDARNAYSLACNITLSIPLIGAKNGLVDAVELSKLSKGDQLRRSRYGDRAIELLRQAALEDFPGLDVVRSDTDLDSIRDRPDFQMLMDEVEKKSATQSN